ncbi:MAG TPA: tetratricopeptide repeat protein [Candidatus Dormibacteraeota bacterium]|nr:tetratricopeptide repeat protein [Candidatus Dormibacteraeota bacterium]
MHISPAILTIALLVSCRSEQSPSDLAQQDQLSSAANDEFALGDRAFNGRNYQEAQRHFERVTQLAPQWPRGWKALGVTLALQNNIEAAEPPLRRACDLSPTEPDACYYLARGLYARDRFVAALKVLQSLLSNDPEPARIEEAIAQAKEGLGEFDDAEKWYRKAVERDPRRRALGLGRFLVRQGRSSEGLPWLKRAVQYQPDSGQARLALGRAYLEVGSADEAISELQQAVRLLPQDAAARHLLEKARSQQAAGRR